MVIGSSRNEKGIENKKLGVGGVGMGSIVPKEIIEKGIFVLE